MLLKLIYGFIELHIFFLLIENHKGIDIQLLNMEMKTLNLF